MTCTVDGCEKPIWCKRDALCNAHYMRLYRHGSVTGGGTPRASTIGSPSRFYTEVVLSYADETCLIWPFNRGQNGYAFAARSGPRTRLIHRRVCEYLYGDPPTPDHQALHSCGKGHLGCVNPKHLRWGTRLDNAADAIAHGAIEYGQRRYNAKLTDAQAAEIKSLRGVMRNKDVCAKFDISSSKVSAIWRGAMWRHA